VRARFALRRALLAQILTFAPFACCTGLVFLATIVVGRLWRRFIGVGASAPLFVLFNVLFLWGVYIFVIRRGEIPAHCICMRLHITMSVQFVCLIFISKRR
jgi:hypothetical protein